MGPATLQGIVYVDPTNAGKYLQGDPLANNVNVTLTGLTLTQQQVTKTVKTDPNGSYQFTGLQPGIYSLTDQPIPSSYTAGASTLGSLGGVVNNDNLLVAVPQGGDGINYDFGLVAVSQNVIPNSPPTSPPAPPPPPPPSPPPPPPPPQTSPPASPPPLPFASKYWLIGGDW
jgi:hypothetical protein